MERQKVVMTDLTLEEKMRCAEGRAREEVAEKHFFDASRPHVCTWFSVSKRNIDHWDVCAPRAMGYATAWMASHLPGSSTSAKDGDTERAFRIRGESGDVVVFDERWDPHRPHPRESLKFRSIAMAMAWIADELMAEPKKEKSS